jgi:transcription elongation factor GreA
MANTISRAVKEKLEKQLEYLISVRKKEVAEQLKEARSFGDLSENAEYDEAKNEQAKLAQEIEDLQQTLREAVVVDDDDISVDEVGFGSVVKLKFMDRNIIREYQIVGTIESDPDNGKISDDSPIGKAALKKKVGDFFEVETPGGTMRLEVLEISRKNR